MPQYMVERHLPGITPEQLAAAAARAKSVTAEMTQRGKPVRYLRSDLPALGGENLLPIRRTIRRTRQRGQRAGADPSPTHC